MNANKQSGPAFPVSLGSPEGHQDSANTWQHPGLTKREYFAALAMQGLASRDGGNPEVNCAQDVRAAVMYADALLAELAKDGAA